MKSSRAEVLGKGFREELTLKERQGSKGTGGSRLLETGMSKEKRSIDTGLLESNV